MKTLKQAKIGDTVRVVKLHGEGAVKRRIMDMGITRGVDVHIRKVAPLGDPLEVTVRGYELSIRHENPSLSSASAVWRRSRRKRVPRRRLMPPCTKPSILFS